MMQVQSRGARRNASRTSSRPAQPGFRFHHEPRVGSSLIEISWVGADLIASPPRGPYHRDQRRGSAAVGRLHARHSYDSGAIMRATLTAVLVLGLYGFAGAQDENADPVGTWKCKYEVNGEPRES